MRNRFKIRWKHWQVINIGLLLYDIIAVNAAYFLALWLRFDCQFSALALQGPEFLWAYVKFIPFYTFACMLVFWRCRLYQSIWRFASYSELLRVILSSAITFVIHTVGITVFIRRMPISYYCIGAMLQFLAVLGVRFAYRFILLERGRRKNFGDKNAPRVLLVGAGVAGQMILRDTMRAKETDDKIHCIIDDNPNKWGRYIDGVPIVGGREKIQECVDKYCIDKIYIAIPSATAKERKEILQICQETGCELKNLPGIYQLLTGEVNVSAMKKVAIEDLLGREPIRVDMEDIYEYVGGKTILVTGGGGSIGSELCRQIAAHHPKQLVIFEVYENNAYDIQQELRKKYPLLDLKVLIGSVRDSRRVHDVFETYKPDVVYHAAAHKHVPLMEDSPNEAIKNNVLGTYKTAYAAMLSGCSKFVLISTDKAVNPTNIMGASKRLCEMIVQSFDTMVKAGKPDQIPALFAHAKGEHDYMDSLTCPEKVKTEFVAVRFGNVLGSNGSVIPLFKRQIEAGGPVTVTHPDIIRYFMTIPEAVSLVLQAGTYAKGGEIFVLDMGSPVKIDALARNLIRLSGYKPDVDIQVEYTGLRPGEKLYEEKLMAEEGIRRTDNELIHIGRPIPFEVEEFLKQLEELLAHCYENRSDIQDKVAAMVSTYHPAGKHGSEEKGEAYLEQMKEITKS
ncbi:MAG: nucleoside-diphosphate sugar epimerase/dehydratase [Faecalimonas sp.]|nr:nucleoside-diphosphate sugar epimerase/dehydratase [Faecalimonas sp.]